MVVVFDLCRRTPRKRRQSGSNTPSGGPGVSDVAQEDTQGGPENGSHSPRQGAGDTDGVGDDIQETAEPDTEMYVDTSTLRLSSHTSRRPVTVWKPPGCVPDSSIYITICLILFCNSQALHFINFLRHDDTLLLSRDGEPVEDTQGSQAGGPGSSIPSKGIKSIPTLEVSAER